MVIPRLVDQALRGAPLTIFGDGSQSRCFCHVSDAVGALLGLASTPEAEGHVFNVGSRDEISIVALAERIRDVVGSTSELAFIPYEQAYEAGFEDMQRRRPDTTRINQLLGWSPQRNLDDIIRDVAHDLRSRGES